MANEVTLSENVKSMANAGKYMVFMLAGEEYGIDILKVQEIIGIIDVTRVPKMPNYIKGVINLRGKIIPVINLRMKFGIEEVEYTDKTCIIVVQVVRGEKSVTMGVVVDEVEEVVDISSEQIEATPDFGSQIDMNFVMGIGKVGKKVKLLLDIDRVMSSDDISAIISAKEESN